MAKRLWFYDLIALMILLAYIGFTKIQKTEVRTTAGFETIMEDR